MFLPFNLEISKSYPCYKIKCHKRRNPQHLRAEGFLNKAWQCPTFTWGSPTLSSALSSFTSEFGMGSGGSRLPLPPGKLVMKMLDRNYPAFHRIRKCDIQVLVIKHLRQLNLTHNPCYRLLGCYMVKPHGQLVQVSFTHYCASTPCLSTL